MIDKREFIETVIEVLYEDDDCPLEVSASMACEIGETLYQKLVEKGIIKP